MVPYAYGSTTLLDVQQVIPLPEAEEYQIRIREKASQERSSRQEQGGRSDRNLRFWSSLLQKANAVIPLHRNVSPSPGNWIAATTHGIYWSYVTAFGAGRVELYITRPDREENKAIFDDLHGHKQDIERDFGGPLTWQRNDEKSASRIYFAVEGGSVDDEGTWDGLQERMVDAMRRLERALGPHVERHRSGGKQ